MAGEISARAWGLVAAVALCTCGAPQAAEPGWRPVGPEGGDITALAVSPSDDAVVYAGTPAGVFRSADGGASWRYAGLSRYSVLALAVDPTTPDTVFAGIDDSDPDTGGVFKTTDGGLTWSPARTGLEDPRHDQDHPQFRYLRISELAADPFDPSTLFAGSNEHSGLFRTVDGGASWSVVGSFRDDVRAIAANPVIPGTFYVSLNQRLGFYRSVDRGETWTRIAEDVLAPSPDNPSRHPTISYLAASGSHPLTVYAASSKYVFASWDGGNAWARLVGADDLTQGSYFTGVAVHPYESATVLVSTELHGIYQSNDGGATWRQVGDGLDCEPWESNVSHKRPTVLAVLISAARFVAGTRGHGVYTRLLDGGTWTAANVGLLATSASSLAVDPGNRHHVITTISGLGVYRSVDGAATWRPANDGIDHPCGPLDFIVSYGPIPYCRSMGDIVWASREGPVLAASECGVYSSVNRGMSWEELPTPSWAGPMAAGPEDGNVVYAVMGGNQRSVDRSADGGESWSDCGEVAAEEPRIFSLAVSPDDPDTVLLGTHLGVYRSDDGCAGWQGPAPQFDGACSGSPADDITAIAFAPQPAGRAFAGSRCGALRSSDGGATWTGSGLDDLEVTAFAFAGSTVFAGTDSDGVWRSSDGGDTWVPHNEGLTNLSISSLTYDPQTRRLFAATSGGGIFVRSVPTAPRHTDRRLDRPESKRVVER